jgi:hypothetical protein
VEYQEPGPIDKERRPNTGTSILLMDKEEGNYVHEPQPELGLEPIDEEGRAHASQGEAEECNYVRNTN